ncbi:MAG TPA: VOC family protein [Ktedonobacterales bacterium]
MDVCGKGHHEHQNRTFAVDNIASEYDRLRGLGVAFTQEPTQMERGRAVATLDDTCGNLIQLAQR